MWRYDDCASDHCKTRHCLDAWASRTRARARARGAWTSEEPPPLNAAAAPRSCDYLVVVLSRASITSQWVSREIELGIKAESSNQMSLLPIKIDPVKPPDMLATRLIADFSVSYESGFSQLIGLVSAVETEIYKLENTGKNVCISRRGHSGKSRRTAAQSPKMRHHGRRI